MLRVFLIRPGEPATSIHGPADLRPVGEGDCLRIHGEAEPQREAARWAGAIGSAVLRGAEVRRP